MAAALLACGTLLARAQQPPAGATATETALMGDPEGVSPDVNAGAPAPAAYQLARIPQASLLPSKADALSAAAAPTSLRLTDTAAFETVALPAPAAGAAVVTPVTVRLAYPAARAGAKVLVHAPDGGSVNGQRGGKLLPIAADGSLVFTFQPDASPGRYALVTRLDDVETILSFTVPATTPK